MKSKSCSKCGEFLPLKYFHKDKSSPDGHTRQCAECRRAKKKEWMQYPETKTLRAKRAREWRATECGKKAVSEFNRIYSNQKRFNGLREIVLENCGYECTECGTKEKLCVHHIDGNGRNSTKPNNTIENLTVLCISCHMRYHQTKRCMNDKN